MRGILLLGLLFSVSAGAAEKGCPDISGNWSYEKGAREGVEGYRQNGCKSIEYYFFNSGCNRYQCWHIRNDFLRMYLDGSGKCDPLPLSDGRLVACHDYSYKITPHPDYFEVRFWWASSILEDKVHGTCEFQSEKWYIDSAGDFIGEAQAKCSDGWIGGIPYRHQYRAPR
jgi:hypothetical protein